MPDNKDTSVDTGVSVGTSMSCFGKVSEQEQQVDRSFKLILLILKDGLVQDHLGRV